MVVRRARTGFDSLFTIHALQRYNCTLILHIYYHLVNAWVRVEIGVTFNIMILEKIKNSDYKELKKLYKSAFPANERAPFFLLKKRAKSGSAEVYIARDNGDFVGFAYLVCKGDAAYLFYFAISEGYRGRGYGCTILRELQRIYSGECLFLAREQLDKDAENYEQRVRRHSFYLRNGFSDSNLKIKEASVVYDVMCAGGEVDPALYEQMMLEWAGTFFSKLVNMKMYY